MASIVVWKNLCIANSLFCNHDTISCEASK